ncbi:hypothetical protein [Nannocystis pusilla]
MLKGSIAGASRRLGTGWFGFTLKVNAISLLGSGIFAGPKSNGWHRYS